MAQLTAAAGFDVWPAWSPDGRYIAFVSGRNSFIGPVHMVRADDGKDIKLAKEVVAKDKLIFDREGKRILSIFRREGGRYSLCWLEVLSGHLGSEVYPDARGLRFALSQDGNSIALVTTQDIREQQDGNNGPACDLWIVPAEGGDRTKVVRFPGRVYDVSWTADDRALYVVTNVGGVHNDLWKVPLKGALGGMRKLTFGQADEDSPSVSSNDRRLWYTDNRRGHLIRSNPPRQSSGIQAPCTLTSLTGLWTRVAMQSISSSGSIDYTRTYAVETGFPDGIKWLLNHKSRTPVRCTCSSPTTTPTRKRTNSVHRAMVQQNRLQWWSFFSFTPNKRIGIELF